MLTLNNQQRHFWQVNDDLARDLVRDLIRDFICKGGETK